MTVFMGGNVESYRIATYDWSTQTYTPNLAKVREMWRDEFTVSWSMNHLVHVRNNVFSLHSISLHGAD
jgi:hypothetical protein